MLMKACVQKTPKVLGEEFLNSEHTQYALPRRQRAFLPKPVSSLTKGVVIARVDEMLYAERNAQTILASARC